MVGSEQGGVRPVLIVQNDTGNRHSPTVIAAAITSQTGQGAPAHPHLPGRHELRPAQGLGGPAGADPHLDKRRLREHMGRVDETMMKQVDTAIAVSFGLHPDTMV